MKGLGQDHPVPLERRRQNEGIGARELCRKRNVFEDAEERDPRKEARRAGDDLRDLVRMGRVSRRVADEP